MKDNQNSTDLKIQVYNKDLQNEHEDNYSSSSYNEKFQEEFYDNFKKEQEKHENDKRAQFQREKKKRDNERLLMNNIISLMNEGKTRNQAACEVGVQTYLVTEWIDKGLNREDAHYRYFYKKVKKIEEKNSSQKNPELEQILCANCGRLTDSGFKFCMHCGSPITVQSASENIDSIKCDYCGKLVDADSKFCFHCGKPVNLQVDTDINFCENCGAKVTDDFLYFCIECGHPLYEK